MAASPAGPNFRTSFPRRWARKSVTAAAGLRLLTPHDHFSIAWRSKFARSLKGYPSAKWIQYESVTRDNVREGAKLAFGEYVNTVYRVDQADVILTLDSDFLTSGPGSVRYAREFARKRRVEDVEFENEPAVLGGIHSHEHRRDGRSSPEDARFRHRGFRSRARARTWIEHVAARRFSRQSPPDGFRRSRAI